MADYTDTIRGALDTIQQIRHAPTPGTYIKQRLEVNAAEISNAAAIEGAIAVANEALMKLVSILYETVDRVPVNVDSRTYRIIVPVPWGDSGYHKWGVPCTEARMLRWVLLARFKKGGGNALFDYDGRKWFLNVAVYKSSALAMDYLRDHPITAGEWMKQVNSYRDKEVKRHKKRRESKSTRS